MDNREMAVYTVASIIAQKQWENLRLQTRWFQPWNELSIEVQEERCDLQMPFAEEIVSVVGPLILRNEARSITVLGIGDYLRGIADIYEKGGDDE